MMDGLGAVLRRGLAGLALALSLPAPQPAQADSTVTKAPAALWAEEIALPQADPAQADRAGDGIAYLLADTQFKRTPPGYTIWDRFAYTVTERTGLEQAAAINLAFDPSREKVILNRLTVIRDGVAQDRLAAAEIDVFRRERKAEQGVYDGWLTAHVDIADIRVGDTIDYAVTYEEAPLFPGAPFRDRFSAEWSVPVAMIRRKFVWPTAEPLQVRSTGTQAAPAVRIEGADTIRLWEIRNPAPATREDNLPPGGSSLGLVEVSSARDWSDVVRPLRAAYDSAAAPLPSGFAAKLDAIAGRFPQPADRMVQALRLVQDQIRYVSLSIGTGSYFPRRPEAVVASGYGDCKDKALLLAAALKRLGIQAAVALTDLDEGQALDQLLPSAAAFDHAVVKARIADRTFWLDATDYLQGGGADTLAQPDYGFALPLDGSSAGLERMTRAVSDEPTTHVSEHFAFPEAEGTPLRFTVSTVYRREDADWMRRQLRSESRAAMRERYEKYYGKTYPGMRSMAPLGVTDDREGNTVTVVERYEQPFERLHADKFIENFPLRMDLGLDRLPAPAAEGRRGAVWLGQPLHRRDTVTVENLEAAFTPPEEAEVDSPFVSLALKPRVTPRLFELDWTLRTHEASVPAAAIGRYLAAVDKIRANERITYDFTYRDPPAKKDAGRAADGGAAPDAAWKTSVNSFLAKAAQAGAAADGSN